MTVNGPWWKVDKSLEVFVGPLLKTDMNKISTTYTPPYTPGPCVSSGHRRCIDGSCIASVDLCPEEQQLNQNTIIIMLVVGMACILFLVVLYCYKQRKALRRQEHNSSNHAAFESVIGEGDNASMNLPPPSYDEVINSNLYPVTPVFQRNARITSFEEPRTPPPNYDAALDILAHSQESVLPIKTQPISPVVRRSISTEFSGAARSARSSESDYRRIYSNPDQR
ncbi:uncharacterized protein LOC131957348 [Physella acuta]|uniref:uncharacterized protein LOC131957348 n=1 Tax=Physella acuta TaxID=109671 RepID=UPI0027DC3FAA|nr:uncharacterized protein LOC131957348 [Physella acuta]